MIFIVKIIKYLVLTHILIYVYSIHLDLTLIISFFPRYHKENNDFRGSFSELTRAFSQGQTSFSVTKKGVVRGNHFHTRKIERFSVIKGKAKIKLREILSNEKLEFIIDGVKPCYIDIPVWYTHNIENIGDEDLITVFWINEHYNDDGHLHRKCLILIKIMSKKNTPINSSWIDQRLFVYQV